MNIEWNSISIVCTREELIELYYALQRDVKRTCETHWRHHPNCWPRDERRIDTMKLFAPFIGRSFEEDMREFNDIVNDIERVRPGNECG